jgi:hypothetical protein
LSLLTEFTAAPHAFKLKGYDWIDIQPIIPDPSKQKKARHNKNQLGSHLFTSTLPHY